MMLAPIRLLRACSCGALLLVVGGSVAGAAEPSAAGPADSDKAKADALFNEGQAELEAGRVDSACAKLSESQKLDAAVGTLLNLARCHELQGKTATAWREYQAAARLAQERGQADRAAGAAKLATELEPKLSKLRIDVPTALAGLVVQRDGEQLKESSFGTFEPLDPGEHLVEARAPEREPWSTKVKLGPSADQQTVAVPQLARPVVAADADGSGGSDGVRVAGLVLGGVGVVGLAIGTAFGVVALKDVSAAKDDPALCPDEWCSPAGRDAINAATTKAHVSTVGLVVGGAALVAGVVMAIAGGSSEAAPSEQATRLDVVPVLGPGTAGVAVGGRF
jgi:hypothetical protein